MTERQTRSMQLIGWYQLAAGLAVLGFGLSTGAWWTAIVGALILAAGLATQFGRGEATSWFRGDLDERRRLAVDRSFRTAFLALAWWVAGVTAVAASRSVPVGLWSAGIVLAVVAAYVDYALVLRRT